MGMLGPSILDLCDRMDITIEQFSWALSGNFVLMLFIPSILGVVLHQLQHRHNVVLSLTLAFISITSFFKIRSATFWVFALCQGIESMLYTITDLGMLIDK